MKEAHRAEVNKERRNRREQRRQKYNQVSQFPIGEDWKIGQLEAGSDDGFGEEEEDEEEEDEEEGGGVPAAQRETYDGAADSYVE
eukprot:gene42921-41488_t